MGPVEPALAASLGRKRANVRETPALPTDFVASPSLSLGARLPRRSPDVFR